MKIKGKRKRAFQTLVDLYYERAKADDKLGECIIITFPLTMGSVEFNAEFKIRVREKRGPSDEN